MRRTMKLAMLAGALAVNGPVRADAAPFAYVSNIQDGTVSVIDTATNVVAQTIATVPRTDLSGIEIDPGGTTAYIGSFSGQVLLLDLATRAFVGSIPAGFSPREIAFTRDGAFAYVTDQSQGAVLKIDTATRQVVGSPIAVGGSPSDIATTNAGFAYVVNTSGYVSVIDLATDRVFAVIPVGQFPNGLALALHPFLPIAYVANQCGGPGSNCGSISVIDTESRLVLSTIQTNRSSTQFVAFTPDGTTAYASNTANPGRRRLR